MFNKRRFLIAITLSVLLGGCAQLPAPATHYGDKDGAGSVGAHLVLDGDTLYSLSQRYNIPMRDLVLMNDISAPFSLDVGGRILLPPPREYKVKAGDSLYAVSRLFDTTTSQIAAQNNLRSPYVLREGQILKLSSAAYVEPPSSKPQSESSYDDLVATPNSKPVRRAAPKTVKTRITAKTPKRSSSKFMQPVKGRILSSYGPKKNGLHNDGINIAAPKGTPVRAAENGVVVYAGSELKGTGNLVLLRHEGRWMTAYAHMDKIKIKRGQVLKRGQTLGTIGSTGSVDSPQLHFEVRRGTRAVNPAPYLQ